MIEEKEEVLVISTKPQRFSWKRIFKLLGIIIAIAGISAAGYFIVNARPVKIAFISLVADNREHYTDCEHLPFYVQVKKALAEHADVVEKIKQAGAFDIGGQEIKCTNFEGGIVFPKGDILIQYETHSQRKAIEKIIGNNFFGIPYRGVNH